MSPGPSDRKPVTLTTRVCCLNMSLYLITSMPVQGGPGKDSALSYRGGNRQPAWEHTAREHGTGTQNSRSTDSLAGALSFDPSGTLQKRPQLYVCLWSLVHSHAFHSDLSCISPQVHEGQNMLHFTGGQLEAQEGRALPKTLI